MEKDLSKLKIALDIDDCLCSFIEAYEQRYPNTDWSDSKTITFNVETLKYDEEFWSNLELIERPDFEPYCYCTKRINSKKYTIKNFKKLGLPIKPIYQLYKQHLNKGEVLKDICDVLIDDSYFNVQQCLEIGFPALLIDRPCNRHIETKYRIYSLTSKEIEEKYHELF